MWQITSPALYHAAGSIEIDPEKKPHIRFLEVVTHSTVVEDVQQLVQTEDCLTDRFNEPILSLDGKRQSLSSKNLKDCVLSLIDILELFMISTVTPNMMLTDTVC